jgi:hypothetical protein
MCAHHEKQSSDKRHHLSGVGWSLLVMGLSLTVVILAWLWFGHIGPTFSQDVLAEQQKKLREHYGLPAVQVVEDPKTLQTPPSLRNLTSHSTGTRTNST